MYDTIAINADRFHRFIVASSIALSPLLAGGCDHAEPSMDPVTTSFRSANSTIATDLAPGDGETWVVLNTGEVMGWGLRYCGANGCSAPADIAPLDLPGPAQRVHANGYYTAAVMGDGTILGWGLGIADPSAPQVVEFAAPVTALTMGADFMCAQLDDGRVQCQGITGLAEPGWYDGFELGGPVLALTAGAHHACAQVSSNTVTCWGDNDSDQLGVSGASNPTTLTLGGSITQLTAGGEHTCALLDTGAVECWGANAEGQRGHDGSGIDSVPLSESITEIAAGSDHTCALAQTGNLYCWGSNDLGQLGAGDEIGDVRQVELISRTATHVIAGPTARTTFAVLDDGGLRGWGFDDVGQTGYGDLLDNGPTTRTPGDLPDILTYEPPEK